VHLIADQAEEIIKRVGTVVEGGRRVPGVSNCHLMRFLRRNISFSHRHDFICHKIDRYDMKGAQEIAEDAA
jgi:hypothetical protein